MDLKDIEITDERLDQITRKQRTLHFVKTISENIKYQKDFEVGDVLVMVNKDGKMLQKNGLVEKWIVARNDNGIVYCRKILKSGKVGQGITAICSNCDSRWRYQMDPDQADSILLNSEYDPAEARKYRQKVINKVRALNKSKRLYFKNDDENVCNPILQQYKPGDTIWQDVYGDGKKIIELTVKEVHVRKARRYGYKAEWYESCEIEIHGHPDRWSNWIRSYNLRKNGGYYYKEKPAPYEKAEVMLND